MNLKFATIVAVAGGLISVSTSAAAAHGPRAQFVAPKAATSTARVSLSKVMHVAGPRNTIIVVESGYATQLAFVQTSGACKGHLAGPRLTVCL